MKATELLKQYAEGKRDFKGTNLRGQNFSGKDLSWCDFSECDIQGANFVGANLTGAKFIVSTAGLTLKSQIMLWSNLYHFWRYEDRLESWWFFMHLWCWLYWF